MEHATREWARRYAELLGVAPPTDEQADALLDLAGASAHAAERTAAPLSTWLVGTAGVSPSEGLRLAEQLAALLRDEGAAGPS